MSNRFGLIYRWPWLYELILSILYKGRVQERFRAVADLIQPGSSVIDLCAGTSLMYNQLNSKDLEYTAIDINCSLIGYLQRKKINSICADINEYPIPNADYIIMCSSLYHFDENAASLIRRMVSSARLMAIILEPIRHFSNSKLNILARLARYSSRVDGVIPMSHYNYNSLEKVLKSVDGLTRIEIISGGRDVLAVYSRDSL